MSEGIRPALTPEEWAAQRFAPEHWAEVHAHSTGEMTVRTIDPPVIFRGHARHALAALALHGQPFGFTRDMRAALQRLCDADLYDCVADDGDGHFDEWCSEERAEDKAHLRAALDCISALLPPEGK